MNEQVSLDDDMRAYIAGYLDGEGCFATGPHQKPLVVCETTHEPTIRMLHSTFGGSFRVAKGRKANHRPTYRWSVVAKDAARTCMILVPFLREKQRQAALLIALQQLKGPSFRRVPPEIKAERERLAQMLKDAKGRLRDQVG